MMTELIEAYADDRVIVYHGECREVLAALAPADGEHGWADAVVCDPPYELAFMGKSWDDRGVAFDPVTWRCCFDVLKPGGHLLAFGGSRTWHRLACAIEDAGFELRDSIAWLYGSGFPKSLDVSKAIDKAAGAEREVIGSKVSRIPGGTTYAQDEWTQNARALSEVDVTAPATDAAKQWQGWGTALKPAFEPIVVARKPLIGTVAANVLAHGTGALNIDACRVAHGEDVNLDAVQRQSVATSLMGGLGAKGGSASHEQAMYAPGGRWPTNVVLDEHQAAELDRQSGITKSTAAPRNNSHQTGVAFGTEKPNVTNGHADTGGASRFFPVFKYQAKAPARERPKVDGVAHPTVKPLELMRWLIKLVTPPGGVIVDPFAGSGTTIEAAIAEGVQVVGIEYAAEYLPLIQARIDRAATGVK